jgi:protein-disulfide isomerase
MEKTTKSPWRFAKGLVIFAVGLGVGYLLAGAGGPGRVVYSGAMTEVEGRPAHGPDDAPVTIVEYTDYECGFCRRYNQTVLPQIMETYEGKIRYLIRHFPLVQIHPSSVRAAQAAVCAEEQDSLWTLHALLFDQAQGLSAESINGYAQEAGLDMDSFEDCMTSDGPTEIIREDMQRGAEYGVQGTPAFFINGRVVYGAQPYEAFSRIIDAALEDAGAR